MSDVDKAYSKVSEENAALSFKNGLERALLDYGKTQEEKEGRQN